MTSTRVTIGFIPLLDCATLVAAVEKGFAAREGIELTLVRETSWANIRDRVIVGQFDAAHMLGPMVLASSLGIGHLTVPMIAPLALGRGGNAITVSATLWKHMTAAGAVPGDEPFTQGRALKTVIRARAEQGLPPLAFAMVYPFSCHNYELRYWLAACGIDPDRDVRLVVIPPPLLVDALRDGQIDGFCVGEPWSSLAVASGVGRIVLPVSSIWRFAPEKVLGCRSDWALAHPQTLSSLIRALRNAAAWCDDAAHHTELANYLAEPRYVGAPAEILCRGLSGDFIVGAEEPAFHVPDFLVFERGGATVPETGHSLWFYSQMVRWRQIEPGAANESVARIAYRPDLYRVALGMDGNADVAGSVDGFFDGLKFDSIHLREYLAALREAPRLAR